MNFSEWLRMADRTSRSFQPDRRPARRFTPRVGGLEERVSLGSISGVGGSFYNNYASFNGSFNDNSNNNGNGNTYSNQGCLDGNGHHNGRDSIVVIAGNIANQGTIDVITGNEGSFNGSFNDNSSNNVGNGGYGLQRQPLNSRDSIAVIAGNIANQGTIDVITGNEGSFNGSFNDNSNNNG